MSHLQEVPTISDINDLGRIFMGNNDRIGDILNDTIPPASSIPCRIMTYNVHMWKGVIGAENTWSNKGIDNYDQIFNTISRLNPTILCLQEVIYEDRYMQPLFEKYRLVSPCIINPSHNENKLYMIIILILKTFYKQLIHYSVHTNVHITG